MCGNSISTKISKQISYIAEMKLLRAKRTWTVSVLYILWVQASS